MKKWISMILFAVSLVASSAMALTEEDFANGVILVPANSEQSTDPTIQHSNRAPFCRTGTKPSPKYCHSRSRGGWYQCGWMCVYDPYTGGA
jgi:hypothetical protein